MFVAVVHLIGWSFQLHAQVYEKLFSFSDAQATNPATARNIGATPRRMTHFGTNQNTGLAANDADPDGDGSTNIDEFVAGTDPNEWSDVFRILSVSWQAAGFTLTAKGKTGRIYDLRLDRDPPSGNWTNVANVGPLSTNNLVTLIDPAPPAIAAFYRIRVSNP